MPRGIRVLVDDERPPTQAGLIVSFIVVALVGGIVAAGLALPALGAANVGTTMVSTTFDQLGTDLVEDPLPQRTEIYANDRTYDENGDVTNPGTLLATFYSQNRVVVPLSDISTNLQNAVIATEDKRFYQHRGVDPQGMARALVVGLVGSGDQQGASTLTQQYVKNVLVQQALAAADTDAQRQQAYHEATVASGADGYARKLREARLAIALEQRDSKKEILGKYLNIAQFGAKSIYGAESAAEYYFGVSAKDLDYVQAATIAGITQNPMQWDPTRNPKDSLNRRNTVLMLMHQQGYITDAEYKAGTSKPLGLDVHEVTQGCQVSEATVAGSGYFCDWVTKILIKDPAFGATDAARRQLFNRGGLTITTTLDPRIQQIASDEVKRTVPVGDPSGAAQVMAVVEPGTGQVKALAQSTDYVAATSTTPGDTAINLNVAQPYYNNDGFQPGSTFKAFTLLTWLEKGHSLNEMVSGSPQTFQMSQFTSCDGRLGGGSFAMHNSEPTVGGMMSVADATKNSVNVAFMNMATKLSLCDIMHNAADLGVVQANPKDKHGQPIRGADGQYEAVPFNDHYPVNVIGTQNTTPLAMAGAFAAFAAGGKYCTPIAITRVVDSSGKNLPNLVPSAGCTQKIEPDVANTMNTALSAVWGGTMKGVGSPGFPAAGKTGTSNNNEFTWFVGYTPRLAAAVAVTGSLTGFKSPNNKTIGGHHYGVIYGSDIAGPTWKRFATAALNDGQPNPGFNEGSNDLIYGKQTAVPDVTGKTVDEATTALTQAGFLVSVSPDQVASDVPAGQVAQQSPTGTATPGSTITLTLSNGQSPGGGGGGPGLAPGNNNNPGNPRRRGPGG